MKTLSWRKNVKLNDLKEDEDTLLEGGPQIERGTVFLRDTRHREVHQRNSDDKRLPREVCFDQDDAEVEKNIVTMPKWRKTLLLSMKTLVEEGPQIERGTVFLRDTCHREIY